MARITYNNDNLCYDCIEEPYLKEWIKLKGTRKKCSFCERKFKCIPLELLAEKVEDAFNTFYFRTPEQQDEYEYLSQQAIGSVFGWSRDGYPISNLIMDEVQVSKEIADEIVNILGSRNYNKHSQEMGEEYDFHKDSYYDFKGSDYPEWNVQWAEFEDSIKTKSRFFNPHIEKFFTAVFKDVEKLTTHSRKSVIVDAGKKGKIKALYRARAFQNDDELESSLERPDVSIGPPPSAIFKPGRMNAAGIAVFYGANKAEVALSEVRPAVGSKVVIAKFNIIRPLKLLDLEALSNIQIKGSIFDDEYKIEYSRLSLLKNLSNRIINPVLPNEELEYVLTQAIADFLANIRNPQIDGIVYKSIQHGGNARNIVLFNKASLVEPYQLPKGTNIIVEREFNGNYDPSGYVVLEETPNKEKENEGIENRNFLNHEELMEISNQISERRIPSLQIDMKSVHICKIQGVSFSFSKERVFRHRFKEINPDDILDF